MKITIRKDEGDKLMGLCRGHYTAPQKALNTLINHPDFETFFKTCIREENNNYERNTTPNSH